MRRDFYAAFAFLAEAFSSVVGTGSSSFLLRATAPAPIPVNTRSGPSGFPGSSEVEQPLPPPFGGSVSSTMSVSPSSLS